MWTTWKVGQSLDYAYVNMLGGKSKHADSMSWHSKFFRFVPTFDHWLFKINRSIRNHLNNHICSKKKTCFWGIASSNRGKRWTLHVHQAECRADELFYRMPVIHFIPMADRVCQNLCKSQWDREDVLKTGRVQSIGLVSFGIGFYIATSLFFKKGDRMTALHVWFDNMRMSVSKLRSIAAWASGIPNDFPRMVLFWALESLGL